MQKMLGLAYNTSHIGIPLATAGQSLQRQTHEYSSIFSVSRISLVIMLAVAAAFSWIPGKQAGYAKSGSPRRRTISC
jgi:hypothetical protein